MGLLGFSELNDTKLLGRLFSVYLKDLHPYIEKKKKCSKIAQFFISEKQSNQQAHSAA